MKPTTILLAVFLGSLLPASAQLTIPSDGSDNALNITESTVIDLNAATDAAWNTSGTGNGVYDANQWAIVFKYSSVNIAPGATVTFKNHRTYAPVVWLVQGNVTIAGTLNLSGGWATTDMVAALTPAEPGPGGFRGGPRGPSGGGPGFGPGGGPKTDHWNAFAEGYAGIYGNPQIIPLIGGSGSGAPGWGGGAAGGGAILIASGGTVNISGNILAKGGGVTPGSNVVAASGGAVRIISALVTGPGSIDATGGGWGAYQGQQPGRVRIETNSLSPGLAISPETIGVPPANPPVIWPAANAPKVRVVSVDSADAPADPEAPLIADADVAIQNNGPVNIILEATNFPIEGVVQLTVIPKFGNRTTHTATRIDGNIAQSTWRVTTTLPQGFVTLQARATQP